MKKVKWRLSLIALFTVVLGLALSVVLHWGAQKQEHQRIFAEFRRDVDELAASFRSELDLALDSLHGIRGLFAASQQVEREEFRIFTRLFLAKQSGIQALEWVPRVADKQRSLYEMAAQRDGYPAFRITQDQKAGMPAPVRAEYFPSYFVEPFLGNELALGFDLAFATTSRVALECAWDSGELCATSRITQVQANGSQQHIFAFLPIFVGNPDNQAARRQQLRGFALGVFRVGDLFNTALQKVGYGKVGIDMQLLDRSAPPDDQLLGYYSLHEELAVGYTYQKLMPNIGGRDWAWLATASVEYVASRHSWGHYLGLTSGVVTTIILLLFLRIHAYRTWEVEQRICARTAQLHEQEAENRIIVETAVNALITINDIGTIESFNPAAEKMFGYSLAEVLGQNVNMLMPEPYYSAHDTYLSNYARTGIAKVIGIGREVVGKRKDGTVFPAYLAVGARELHQKNKYVGFLLDITNQKAADRMKSEFVSTVSHELRTPLTAIKGGLGLVVGGVVGAIPAKALHLLTKALQNTDRLALLIDDLLDMEKIQAGKMDFHMGLLQVGTLIKKSMISSQGYADSFGIRVVLAEAAQLELKVYADEHRLMQVMANLLSNAIKFSPQQGEVELRVARQDSRVRISVADAGPGIPEEFCARIFQRFAQADGSDTRGKGGTGLGLAISKSIIEKHGGVIGYAARQSGGTVFYFDLPEVQES